jgi:hypothetical protein
LELKAYFGRTIVGEPEVAQTLKYFAIIKSNEELNKQIEAGLLYPPKFMLITSGILTLEEDNSLLNGELEKIADIDEKVSYIKSQYKGHLKDLGWTRSLEARDTRSIYYNASSKIKRYYRDNNWGSPNILQLKKPVSLIDIIEDNVDSEFLTAVEVHSADEVHGTEEAHSPDINEKSPHNKPFDVILIPADIFEGILLNAGMVRERELFNRIRVTWMERLIFDNNILVYDIDEEQERMDSNGRRRED